MIKLIEDLSPVTFENFCFDIIRDMGFYNPSWRTPGPDGGRDIEAWRNTVDPTFTVYSEHWFIECKKYSSSINWPIVHEKCAHAEALGADYLFLMTTSSASPTCTDRIGAWNKLGKKPKIRVWGGHDITAHISIRPHIKMKYGLDLRIKETIDFTGVSLEMSKIIATMHSLHTFNRNVGPALEYANTLARCWAERAHQLNTFGKFLKFPQDIDIANLLFTNFRDTDRRRVDLGELLNLSWLRFILEKDELNCTLLKNSISIDIELGDKNTIMTTPSGTVIQLISDAGCQISESCVTVKALSYE